MTDKIFSSSPVLLLISGPAGSGKTTLCERLMAHLPNEISRAVTCTTRKPRENEKDGRDYFFLSHEEFERGIAAGDFLEHAQVYSNLYGVRHAQVRERLDSGQNVLLNLDVQGAATVRKLTEKDPFLRRALVSVFIMPKSVEELRKRLAGRGTDAPEEVEHRMKIAEEEMQRFDEYDYCLISGTREEDFAKLLAIYEAAKMRV